VGNLSRDSIDYFDEEIGYTVPQWDWVKANFVGINIPIRISVSRTDLNEVTIYFSHELKALVATLITSNYTISGPTIVSVIGVVRNTSSVTLTIQGVLLEGTYTVGVAAGTVLTYDDDLLCPALTANIVIPQETELLVVGASRIDEQVVKVEFSRTILPTFAPSVVSTNYAISGPSSISVESVALGSDGLSVELTVSGDFEAGEYTTHVNASTAQGLVEAFENVASDATFDVFETTNLGAPTITQMEPAPGTAIGRYQPISFTATDPDGIGACFIWASYEALGLDEVVYDGEQFTTRYAGTMVGSETELSFSGVLRKGGWPVSAWKIRAPHLHVAAIDTLGAQNV
jgi:hypothetical protein